ncbi:MAG: hypothetical protein H6719_34510 [Sandaracinaceae bacterium]|nr:hypothetical protein [Sandaracinaceae bacterium]
MSRRTPLAIALVLAISAPLASLAFAQARHPHPPPPEAIAACDSQDEGSRCEFQSPHGTIEGTCQTPRDRLVCVPDGPPPGRPPAR